MILSNAVLIKERSYKTFLCRFEILENSTLKTDVIGLYIFSMFFKFIVSGLPDWYSSWE